MRIEIGITAANFAGNKGAAAMLQSVIKNIKAKDEDVRFSLLSVYPEEDRSENPYSDLKIVSAKPEQMLFIAFPLAVLFYVFRFFAPIRKLILKNKTLKGFTACDLVVDAAGISFVDNRGFVMSTYNFVCVAIPLLLGKPVIKVSQAMGPIKKWYNRIYANWALTKLAHISARGEYTYAHLKDASADNLVLAADIAFLMPDDTVAQSAAQEIMAADDFYKKKFISLSISSVVYGYCKKSGIDYLGITRAFIEYLNQKGYGVLLVANAAREGKAKLKNNDLPVGEMLYASLEDKSGVRWYNRAFTPEAIRLFISKSHILVASRFHAMIGALEKAVPVLLVGWSHKYQEVLDMFGLGELAVDYKTLKLPDLIARFENVEKQRDVIRDQILAHLPEVKASAEKNFSPIFAEMDKIRAEKEKYIGKVKSSYAGYMLDENIRGNAASGGMVTGMLLQLLKTGQIDGALVARQHVANGKIVVDSFIATSAQEILDCSTSIYTEFNINFKALEAFDGKVAVVCLPCQLKIIQALDKNIQDKIAYKLCLFCGGVAKPRLMARVLEKNHIDIHAVERIYARKGHWRGNTIVVMKNGEEKQLSYNYNWSVYKNAFYYSAPKCFRCQDHFGLSSDISFGDIWLAEMKDNPIKHTAMVARNDRGEKLVGAMEKAAHITKFLPERIQKGNKRSLVYKFKTAEARRNIGAKYGMKGPMVDLEKSKWNHRLAARLIIKNMLRSQDETKMERTFKKNAKLMFLYMGFIRLLLSF
ncbi:MAG: polysaccharide pyruvyl transferase family protein [Eubacteriales bacterium]